MSTSIDLEPRPDPEEWGTHVATAQAVLEGVWYRGANPGVWVKDVAFDYSPTARITGKVYYSVQPVFDRVNNAVATHVGWVGRYHDLKAVGGRASIVTPVLPTVQLAMVAAELSGGEPWSSKTSR